MRILKIFLIVIFILLLPFFFAILQLNSLSLLLDKNPKIIGIQKNRNEIVASLKENNMVPNIVVTVPEKVPFAIATAMSGEDNIYAKYVVSVIPQTFVLKQKEPDISLFLMDNTLFIVDINASDLEVISPVVGYLYVKKYFPDREIKAYPNIHVLDKKDYRKSREEQVNKKIEEIESEMLKVMDAITKISSSIHKDQEMIVINKNIVNEGQVLKAKNKNKTIRKKLDREIAQAKKNISDWSTKLQHEQKLLTEYRSYADFYKKQRDMITLKKGNISYELGVFEPKKDIKIMLAKPYEEGVASGLSVDGEMTEQEELLAYYWGTLLHEYLHYTSYVAKDPATARQGKKITSSFFEEGLTEYFTRKITVENSTMRASAYPTQVKIIAEMMKKISEKELEEIYFSKDEKRLEEVVNKAYGKDFYKNNQIVFQTLEYTSDPKQALTIANSIMKKIGGKPMTEKDL